jgi:hypothetical protein
VQYYLNVQREENNKSLNDKQQQALVSGLTLGVSGMTSNEELSVLVQRAKDNFYDRSTERRLKDIIVINSDWEIYESLNADYKPDKDQTGIWYSLSDIQDCLLRTLSGWVMPQLIFLTYQRN